MDRQDKLDAVLKDLQAIPGIKQVVSDDFTDEGYWVFLTLAFKGYKPAVPLRSTKAAIARVVRRHNVPMSFLDWPVPVYNRDREFKYLQGYDKDAIKIDLAIRNDCPKPVPMVVQQVVQQAVRLDERGRPKVNWGRT